MRYRLGLLLAAVCLSASSANASVDLGTDIFFSGLAGQANEVHLRTRNYLYLDMGSVAVGVVARIEQQHSYLFDTAVGPSVRFGQEFTFEVEGGIIHRRFDGISGNGFWGGIVLGWQLSKNFRIAVPVTLKSVKTGSDDRLTIDYLPYIGVKVTF